MNMCMFGFHTWPKWEQHAQGNSYMTDLPTGTKVQTGIVVIQKRQCTCCAKLQMRRVYTGLLS